MTLRAADSETNTSKKESSTTEDRTLRAFYQKLQPFDAQQAPDRIAALLRALRSTPRPDGPIRILDVGCGNGQLTDLLRSQLHPATAIGVDFAHQALIVGRERSLTVVQASVDQAGLPFASGSFDMVFMSEVIEHLVDPDLALSEARRVLIPTGHFFLTTPNLAAWFNRLLLLAGVQPVFSEVSRLGIFGRPGTEVVGHLRLFTKRALTELLAVHGFVDIQLSGAAFHAVPRSARWLDRFLARCPSLAAVLLARARVLGVSSGVHSDP